MTDLDLTLLAVILALLVALAGVMVAWQGSAWRADEAEIERDRYKRRAKRAMDEARRNAREAQQFASLPREPARITNVNEFINDVFRGR